MLTRILKRAYATIVLLPALAATVVLAANPALAQDAAPALDPISGFLGLFGLKPEYVAIIVALVMVFERIGKAIPDTATGVLGWIRRICKFLGGYVTNKT
jgi:hypothetical protein